MEGLELASHGPRSGDAMLDGRAQEPRPEEDTVKSRFSPRQTALAAVFLALVCAGRAGASQLDLRAGSYTDLEKPFVGLGFLSHVHGTSLYFNPNVEYVFVDNGHFGTLNFDAHYDLPTGGAPYIWIGGGLALVHSAPDNGSSTTDARANLLAGLGLRLGHSVPYVQAKYITGYGEFVAAVGFRF